MFSTVARPSFASQSYPTFSRVIPTGGARGALLVLQGSHPARKRSKRETREALRRRRGRKEAIVASRSTRKRADLEGIDSISVRGQIPVVNEPTLYVIEPPASCCRREQSAHDPLPDLLPSEEAFLHAQVDGLGRDTPSISFHSSLPTLIPGTACNSSGQP